MSAQASGNKTNSCANLSGKAEGHVRACLAPFRLLSSDSGHEPVALRALRGCLLTVFFLISFAFIPQVATAGTVFGTVSCGSGLFRSKVFTIAVGDRMLRVRTDEQGRYEAVLPEGRYLATIAPGGYQWIYSGRGRRQQNISVSPPGGCS